MDDLTPPRYRFGIIRRRFDVEHPIQSNTHHGNKIFNAHKKDVNRNDLAVVDLRNSNNCLSPPRLRPGILRRRCNEKSPNVLDSHSGRHEYIVEEYLQCREMKYIFSNIRSTNNTGNINRENYIKRVNCEAGYWHERSASISSN